MNSFDMYASLGRECVETSQLAADLENMGESELAESMLVRVNKIGAARIKLTARIMRNPKALAKLHACCKAAS